MKRNIIFIYRIKIHVFIYEKESSEKMNESKKQNFNEVNKILKWS